MQWLKPLPSKCLPCKVSPSLWAWRFSPRGSLLSFWWPGHRSAPWFPKSSSLFSFRALHRLSSACLCCLPVCPHRELHPTHSLAPSQLCPRRLICKTQQKRTPSTPAISKVWHQGRSAIIKPITPFQRESKLLIFKKFSLNLPTVISKHSEQWMNYYTGVSVSDRFLFSFSLLAVPTACGNLVPQLETKPVLPMLGSCTRNPQTIREVPLVIFNDIFFSFANKLYKELKKKGLYTKLRAYLIFWRRKEKSSNLEICKPNCQGKTG